MVVKEIVVKESKGFININLKSSDKTKKETRIERIVAEIISDCIEEFITDEDNLNMIMNKLNGGKKYEKN